MKKMSVKQYGAMKPKMTSKNKTFGDKKMDKMQPMPGMPMADGMHIVPNAKVAKMKPMKKMPK